MKKTTIELDGVMHEVDTSKGVGGAVRHALQGKSKFDAADLSKAATLLGMSVSKLKSALGLTKASTPTSEAALNGIGQDPITQGQARLAARKDGKSDPINGVGQDPIAEGDARMKARDKFRGSRTK